MTLHWWMHWFWVTALRFTVIMGAPLPLTTSDYTAGDSHSSIRRTDLIAEVTGTTPTVNSYASPAGPEIIPDSLYSQNYRVAKAIGGNPSALSTSQEPAGRGKADVNGSTSSAKRDENSATQETNDASLGSSFISNRSSSSLSSFSSAVPRRDSKITWIVTANETSPLDKTKTRGESISEDDRDDLAVLPLQEAVPTTRFKLVLNRAKSIPSAKISDGVSAESSERPRLGEEENVSVTPASVSQEASESPRLSRARSAFSGEYQQDQEKQPLERQQERLSEGPGNATSSAIDIAAVTGSCLASVVLLGTMGSLGFVMYRRRYLNPPQTLNSDKCSNPDSSGYIDDSTVRDNSEEMYSLDNDSFLNSLEAMTIQNYWTDSVKHTKL